MNGRQALGRCRNLDHQIAPIDLPPQALGLLDGSLRVGCEIGRHFNTDKAVGPVCGVKYGAKHVGRAANILDREFLEDLPGRLVMALQQPLDAVVVFFGAADRLFKNRWI